MISGHIDIAQFLFLLLHSVSTRKFVNLTSYLEKSQKNGSTRVEHHQVWSCEWSSWCLGTRSAPPLVFLLRHCFTDTPHLTLPTFDVLLAMNWAPLGVQLWEIFLTLGHTVRPSTCLPLETLIHWHLNLSTSDVVLAMSWAPSGCSCERSPSWNLGTRRPSSWSSWVTDSWHQTPPTS